MKRSLREAPTDIWQFEDRVGRRLLAWAVGSVVTGGALALRDAFWRGVGIQYAGWGLVDGLLALVARRRARARAGEPAGDEARRLRRIFAVNTGLDVLYVLGGLGYARSHEDDDFRRGNGWGVVVQGGFLLLFDLLHALNTPAVGVPRRAESINGLDG
jgi:hypothetical protein